MPIDVKQQRLFKPNELACGGDLYKKAKGRAPRSLTTKETMHLILKSSKATHQWSFRTPANRKIVQNIVRRFAKKFGISVLSLANVGNHLHFHIKLNNRYTYPKWIRAITSAIAMKITGMNRWNGGKMDASDKFWDYRPFTRVIRGFRALLTIKDYVLINQLEGSGIKRAIAEWIVKGRLLSG